MVLDVSSDSSDKLTLPLTGSLPDATSKIPSIHYYLGYYEIESMRKSEPACLFFARHQETQTRIVIKILLIYEDPRYHLTTVNERQRCQIEALNLNRMFTPSVYIGLAHISHFDQRGVIIDQIFENPSIEELDPNTEYFLLMHQLSVSRRLDCLLEKENDISLQSIMQLLTKYFAYIHTKIVTAPSMPNKDGLEWGSPQQLQRKLMDNLALFDLALTKSKIEQYKTYKWLKDKLTQIFIKDTYQQYFMQRMREGRIKRCHGDLKSPHIWIASNDQITIREPWRCVYLLDAIDFNPIYNHIDILSDFAMFIIDIRTRTKSSELADFMIENYLKSTEQDDEAAKAVLAYYIVEKAVMWAAVSILYDNSLDLGLAFLDVAENFFIS